MKLIPRDTPIRAWHFLADDHRMRDGVTAPPDGEWLVYPGMPTLCQRGLHASIDPFDALRHAPGTVLCMVDCAGVVIEGNDKLVCTDRRIVARMEAEPLLCHFARQQALSVIDNWQTDPAEVVLDWLMGDDTARSAARSAAWSAAWSAARSAEWSAAAWSAAWSAVRSAARSPAAWSVARSAEAWSAARQEFNALVNEAFVDWI